MTNTSYIFKRFHIAVIIAAVIFAAVTLVGSSYFEAAVFHLKAEATGFTDVCPNISGIQTQVPAGMEKKDGNCVPKTECKVPVFKNTSVDLEATEGVSFSYTIELINPDADTILSVTGLPAGLTLLGNVISGTPTEPGLFTVNVKAENKCGNCIDVIRINVKKPPCIAPTLEKTSDTVHVTLGGSFSYTVTATGTSALIFNANNLPSGVQISNNVISGTPTEAGTFTVSVTVKNDCGEKTFTLTVVVDTPLCTTPIPTITSSETASGTVGSSFSYTFTTDGTVTTKTTSNLPQGLIFDSATGVISGIPTTSGTFTVTLHAENNCGGVDKTLTITITTGGSVCTDVAPSIGGDSEASVQLNQAFSYPISISGTVTSFTVDNLPSWLHLSDDKTTLFGTPPGSGDFTVTMTAVNGCTQTQKTLTIHVFSPVCTTCGGGGGFFTPTVVLIKATSSPLAALTSIYLSQVPYTGIGDMLTTIGFIAALVVLSLIVAFLIVRGRKNAKEKGVHNQTFAQNAENDKAIAQAIAEPVHSFSSQTTSISPKEIHGEVKTFHSEGISNSVSEGLEVVKNSLQGKTAEEETLSDSLVRKLTNASREKGVLIDHSGALLIVAASDNKEENALRILNQMIGVAREWYPQSGELLLDAKKIRGIFFSTYVSMIPLFIGWVADNDGKKVFNFIKMLNAQGHATSDFLKNVAFELDRVYRFRTESERGADEYAIQRTVSWKKETLERVVSILVGAFDESYTSGYTASKLALSKVFDVLEREKGNHIPTLNLKELA